ncbi:MAG: hypothetical protein GJ676_16505 [Rhodobacteraceae bacterium]|nr:hypothetical protein [Paracoccaceae bacterium]
MTAPIQNRIVNVNQVKDYSGTSSDDVFVLNAISSGLPTATLDGRSGFDTLDARSVFVGGTYMFLTDVRPSVENGFSVGDFLVLNFWKILGNSTKGNWFLLQDTVHSVELHGGAGNDWFAASIQGVGGWTADKYFGYAGDDHFNVRPLDVAIGGAGNDTFDLYGASGDLTGSLADGGSGTDTLELGFGWTVNLSKQFADSPFSGSLDRYKVVSIENVEVYA